MIPRLKPYLKLHDLLLLWKYRKESYSSLEKYLARLAGSKYVIILPYGRSAIGFFLKSQAIKNKEVIVPAYSCQSILGPILDSENAPIFVDAKPDNFNMDEENIEKVMSQNTKAIIATSMYGLKIANLAKYKVLKKRGVILIGDYALGLLTYLTKQKEVLDIFDLIFFSFGLGKEITFLGGGAVITNSEKIYKSISDYRDHNCKKPTLGTTLKNYLKFIFSILLFEKRFYGILYWLSEKTHFIDGEKGISRDINNSLPQDYGCLPTRLQVSIGFDRLTHINDFIDNRNKALDYYFESLEGIDGRIFLPPRGEMLSHFPILVPKAERGSLITYLNQNGIHATTIFKKPLNELLGENRRSFKNAKKYADEMIVLPLYYGIDKDVIDKTVNLIREWLRGG